MPDKNPATDRHHGGPGSSAQNAKKPEAERHPRASGGRDNEGPEPNEPTNPDHSRVSGGGGEQDRHHTHDPRTKR